ncbi:MAG: DUF444 family protein [Clostridium butyricum]
MIYSIGTLGKTCHMIPCRSCMTMIYISPNSSKVICPHCGAKNFYIVDRAVEKQPSIQIEILKKREVKDMKKYNNIYVLLDASGSVEERKFTAYEQIVKKIEKENSCSHIHIISFNTRAKFIGRDLKKTMLSAGGTYISSGLKLALGNIFTDTDCNNTNKIYLLTDGDNWTEDNNRTIHLIKAISDISNIDFEYVEIFPSFYSTSMGDRLNKEYNHKEEIHILTDENKVNDYLGLTKEVILYQIEHTPNGKLYDFISDDETLSVGATVVCDTCRGKQYGIVKSIKTKQLTKEELKQYKKCRYIK